MDGQGEACPDLFQVAQVGPAGDHIVLGVHLEEVQGDAGPEDLRDILRLQTDADDGRACGWGGHGRSSAGAAGVGPYLALKAASWP